MARNTAPEDAPTSDWEHSHALQEGDKLVHTDELIGEKAVWEIEQINDDGSVRAVMVWQSPGSVEGRPAKDWSEKEITTSLADFIFGRKRDGKSHELAT